MTNQPYFYEGAGKGVKIILGSLLPVAAVYDRRIFSGIVSIPAVIDRRYSLASHRRPQGDGYRKRRRTRRHSDAATG